MITHCISTHNNINYLKLAIKSVREHSYYKESPFVIYAENCNDGTDEWLKENSERYNLEYYIEKNNIPLGIGGGMNFCANKVKTEFISFIHSDFYVAENWDIELLNKFKKYPNTPMMVFSHRIQPNIFNEKPGRPGTHIVPKDEFGEYHNNFNEKYFLEWCKEFNEINDFEIRKGEGVSGLIRKSDWDMVGGNDPLFAPASWEDMDLFIRMQLKNIKIVLTSKSLVYHFGARGSHFINDDFDKRSQRQIEAEQNNQKKWITKWNKYPEFDELEFVKSNNMEIIKEYEGKHK
jgi:GT2 family glycosyltransferase